MKAHRLQFSLRSLLIFVPVVGAAVGIPLGIIHQRQEALNRALREVRKMGGTAQRHLDRKYDVGFDNVPITDDDLRKLAPHLEAIPDMDVLTLYGARITDDGVKHLTGLKSVETLSLMCTDVTEKGALWLHEKLPDCYISYSPRGSRCQVKPEWAHFQD